MLTVVWFSNEWAQVDTGRRGMNGITSSVLQTDRSPNRVAVDHPLGSQEEVAFGRNDWSMGEPVINYLYAKRRCVRTGSQFLIFNF